MMAEPILTTKILFNTPLRGAQRHQEKLTNYQAPICIPWCLGALVVNFSVFLSVLSAFSGNFNNLLVCLARSVCCRHARVFGVTSQKVPCSALLRARRGLVTPHGADSRRVFSRELAEQDT